MPFMKYIIRFWAQTFIRCFTTGFIADALHQYAAATGEFQKNIAAAGAARDQGAAAYRNAQTAATPSMQPGQISGTYYLPEQLAMGQKMFDAQMGLFDKLTGYLDNWQPMGGDGAGTPAGSFADYFSGVAGGMPGVNFTDVPIQDVITPQMLSEQINNLFANQQSKAGAGALGLFRAGLGMATNADAAAHNAALLDAGTRAGIAREYANRVPSILFQNAQQKLAAHAAQTNVENSRLNQYLQQGQMALGQRGQDIQNSLGQGRLAVDDRGNFLRAIGGMAGGFGGFGGFGQPLSFSQSGPSGYIFPSDQYQPVAPAKLPERSLVGWSTPWAA